MLELIAIAPPTSGTPLTLYLLGALLAGGGLTILADVVRRWRRGQMEDTELISRITKDTITGAKDILEEYRLEVEVVKRQLDNYREQLSNLFQQLAEANVRIRSLEDKLLVQEKDLSSAQTQRDQLIKDLESAVEERHSLTAEIVMLRQEISKLLGQTENGS